MYHLTGPESSGNGLVPRPSRGKIKTHDSYAQLYSEHKIPFLNSRQLLWTALSDPEPVRREGEFTELGVISDRQDRRQIFGVAYTIDAIANNFLAAASNPWHDKGTVLYGPSGWVNPTLWIFSSTHLRKLVVNFLCMGLKDVRLMKNLLIYLL